jgi:hypothetical protein
MTEALHTTFARLPYLAAVAALIVLALMAMKLPRKRTLQVLSGSLFVLLAIHTIVFLQCTLAYISFPYEQKSVVEGVTVYNATQYLQGETPYRDPKAAPFTSINYPPFHDMALAGVMAILGGPSLVGGRLFSLLCVLGTLFVAGLAVWQRTKHWPATLFAGGFTICCYGLTLQWMEQARNDALLMFLIVLGVHLADRAMAKKKLPIGALIVLLLALYTKQTALFAVAAVAIILFIQNRRRAIIWSSLFVLIAGILLAGMEVWSGGWFHFYLLTVPASVGFRWGQIDFALTFFLMTLGAGIAAVALSWRPLRDMAKEPRAALWPLAFALGLPLCLLQSVKWGATMNAFVPLLPIMGILAGLWFQRCVASKRTWVPAVAGGVILLQLGLLNYAPKLPTASHYKSHERIAELVKATKGDVLVSGFSAHVFMNHKTYYGDPVIMGDLEEAGLWPKGESAVIKKVQSRGFGLIIHRPINQMSPSDLVKAVKAHYRPAAQIPFDHSIGGWEFLIVSVPK